MPTRDNRIVPNKKVKLGKYTKSETYLAKQCKAYGVNPPPVQPIGNRCLVWRFPPVTMSSGAHGSPIIIPMDLRSPHQMGLLVAAGPQAQDYLKSHGIKLGDAVMFTRFGGDESNISTPTRETTDRYIWLSDKDILGSLELRTDLEKGKTKYVTGEDGKTKLERRKELPAMSDKKAKVLRLAKAGATEAERETASRLAARMK